MSTSTKPQCSAHVVGETAAGQTETFFCLLREGHRGRHQYHESLARETPDVPPRGAGMRPSQ